MNSEKQSTNLQMTLRGVNRVGEGQKNVPKLRFKGYEDNWKHSELGEVLSELYNGQTPSRFREENWNGDINWLTSGELNRDIVYKTIEKITRIGQVDANLRIVPEGIFVMAITGLEAAGTRGNCAILGIPTTLNQSCMALFPKENILFTGFLFQWYKKNGEKYGLVYTQGTKQRSYNAELIKKLPIAFPVYNEQKKISIILRSLDHYLTLYQNRIEELQKMKKTLLLKMFPKNGEAVPEIRFKGFTDAWEQRKLDCTNTVFTDGNYGESYPKPSDMTDSISGVPFLTGGNLRDGKLSINGASYITLDKHLELTSGHLEEDDIVIAVRGSLGALGYVNYNNAGWNINSQLAILRTNKNELYGAFLIQYLLSQDGQNELLKRQTGSALKQLPIKSLKDLKVPISSVDEQKEIANFLSQLDNRITLHQRRSSRIIK